MLCLYAVELHVSHGIDFVNVVTFGRLHLIQPSSWEQDGKNYREEEMHDKREKECSTVELYDSTAKCEVDPQKETVIPIPTVTGVAPLVAYFFYRTPCTLYLLLIHAWALHSLP